MEVSCTRNLCVCHRHKTKSEIKLDFAFHLSDDTISTYSTGVFRNYMYVKFYVHKTSTIVSFILVLHCPSLKAVFTELPSSRTEHVSVVFDYLP